MGQLPIFQIQSEHGNFWSRSLLGLIEGIYERNEEMARKILREWIECGDEPTFLEKEITKVAAKRIRRNPLLQPLGEELIRPPFHAGAVEESSKPRHQMDREVRARLYSRSGSLLAESKNTNGKIRTRHAEMNLIDSFQGKFPKGSTLVVSLKPCRMCAARIWESAEEIHDFKVIFIENDPGPLAKGTLLDPKSPARLRAFGVKSPLYELQIQFKQTDGVLPQTE